jgi:hypothetical protein
VVGLRVRDQTDQRPVSDAVDATVAALDGRGVPTTRFE